MLERLSEHGVGTRELRALVLALRRPSRLAFALFLAALTSLIMAGVARADEVPPPPPRLPPMLSLDDALRLFRAQGLDLLIAEATTRNAEGAVQVAGAVPNPVVTGSVGNALTYSTNAFSKADCLRNGAVCSPWLYNVGVTDSAALEDSLSGKRGLRLKVARNALAAAKMNRVDAERTLVLQVKTAYAQIAQATLAYKFAKEIAATQATTLRKFEDRMHGGAASVGDVQRIEVQKLEADQAVDTAENALRGARVALAFLLGVRGEVSDFDVDTGVLAFSLPAALRETSAEALLRSAFGRRPDLAASAYTMASNRYQLELVRRQRFPDVTLGVNYAWGGFGGVSTNGPLQGQTLTFSLSAPLPIFYSLTGEARQAHAQYDVSALQQAKATAQVASDVSAGLASFTAARRLVERMEGARRDGGGILESARGAFEALALQYERGSGSLTDYLDALRTYIAVKNEYFGDLASYWIAVYQLEAAVGVDLR